jgi:hypothetical protein
LDSDVDTRKIISSLTLFRTIAERAHEADTDGQQLEEFVALADEVLARGAAQGYPPCSYTIDVLVEYGSL